MTAYSFLSDETLLELLKDQDETAFTELFDRYWERLFIYVLKATKSHDDAQDIVQELFLSIWRRQGKIELKSSLIAYLLKGARNLSLKFIEHNIRKIELSDAALYELGQADVASVSFLELQELEERVDSAIAKLPPKMQQVYLLSRHENLSYHEISMRLGIAETTVKKQVSNALKSIRVEIGLSASSGLYLIFFEP